MAEPNSGVNALWQDVPNSAGFWWGVNPAEPGEWVLAKVFYEGGRMAPKLRLGLAGDTRLYPVAHFEGFLVWQRAVPPAYSWPASGLSP